jgi:hypothetical protein
MENDDFSADVIVDENEKNAKEAAAGGPQIVDTQDLTYLLELKHKATLESAHVARVAMEQKVAELEYFNFLLSLYVKYGLKENMSIEEKTGAVMENAPEEDKEKA